MSAENIDRYVGQCVSQHVEEASADISIGRVSVDMLAGMSTDTQSVLSNELLVEYRRNVSGLSIDMSANYRPTY